MQSSCIRSSIKWWPNSLLIKKSMKAGEWSWSYRAASLPTDNLSLALYIVNSLNVNRLKYIQDSIWASACHTAQKKPLFYSIFFCLSLFILYFWGNWELAGTDFSLQTQSCPVLWLNCPWSGKSYQHTDDLCHFIYVLPWTHEADIISPWSTEVHQIKQGILQWIYIR